MVSLPCVTAPQFMDRREQELTTRFVERQATGMLARKNNSPDDAQTRDTAAAPRASILLVDDDPRNLLALQELLGDLGHQLVPAKSGAEALRQSLQRDFALILLDVLMPDMDGFEVARLIRERERSRHTPIIFLTGAYEDSPSMFRGYEAGAVDYIIKPLNPDVLKSKIAVFIELYRKSAVLSREIAERKQAEEQLRQSEERLRALTARLQSVREEERTTISREIHDELGQSLTGLKMDLTWLANHVKGEQKHLAPKFKSMFGLIDETIQSVRRIASGLRPEVLDEAEGLTAAIAWQARHFQMRTGIRCKVDLPAESPVLDQERSTATFRIFQEVLTNVARHAEATRLDVSMKLDTDRLRLEVKDNGKGIPDSAVRGPKSLGLLGMHERATLIGGKIDITGAPGKGTKVTLSIPLTAE
jgi:signal transduction histidine kinase